MIPTNVEDFIYPAGETDAGSLKESSWKQSYGMALKVHSECFLLVLLIEQVKSSNGIILREKQMQTTTISPPWRSLQRAFHWVLAFRGIRGLPQPSEFVFSVSP